MTEFMIDGMIVKRSQIKIQNRNRIDLIIEDSFGQSHYIQARPNQFGAIAALPDRLQCKFIAVNEFSESNGKNFNNLILRQVV